MRRTGPTRTAGLWLAELVERLTERPEVEAVALLGSATTGALQPASDYDLLVALADPATKRARWRVSL